MIHKLLEELSLLNLPVSGYVIIGSGPLAIRGIREAKDLDILVCNDVWNQLSKRYPTYKKGEYSFIKVSENIEVHGERSFTDPTGDDPTQEENIREAEVIAGYPFQCIKHFLYYRYKYRSDKELADAKLIEEWLQKNSTVSK